MNSFQVAPEEALGQQDRERMILMQQRKVASIDAAASRLAEEGGRMGQRMASSSGGVRVVVGQPTPQNQQQEDPRTVEQLLDSLHSTPI